MNQPSIKEEIETYAKELHLPTIRAMWESAAGNAAKEEAGYGEYLLELLEKECESRRQKRIQRLLRESNLPLEKNLQSFDLKRLPTQVARQAKVLLQGDFLERKENVLAFGNPGSGKTHLLCALGIELVHQNRRVFFSTCGMLIQALLRAKKELTFDKTLKKLSKFDALILDDIGYVQYDTAEMEVLFALMAHRYEKGSLMITSNLPFSKWDTIFKNPMTTAAAIDRVVHHSVILELNVKSYRMEQAQKDHKDKRQPDQSASKSKHE